MLSSAQMGKCDAQVHSPWQNPKSAHFISLQVSCYRGFQQASSLTYSGKMLKRTEELVRMGRCWENSHPCLNQRPITCLLASHVFVHLLLRSEKFGFFQIQYFILLVAFEGFLQTSQAIRRTNQESDEERAEMQNTLVLLGSDTAQVTSLCLSSALCKMESKLSLWKWLDVLFL